MDENEKENEILEKTEKAENTSETERAENEGAFEAERVEGEPIVEGQPRGGSHSKKVRDIVMESLREKSRKNNLLKIVKMKKKKGKTKSQVQGRK